VAVALLPFVKIPTGSRTISNGNVEGGLKIPYAFDVPGWEIGLQSEFSLGRGADENGYHEKFANSLSVGHRIIGRLSYFVEFYAEEVTVSGRRWAGTLDTWLTYQLNENLRLDGGIYIGVTEAADDWHPFLGMTWRY
jgi:hypothetical protein